jgi:hypothetical protein
LPELDFTVTGSAPVRHSASPELALELRIGCGGGQALHGILLDCQVRIEPARRGYDEHEAAGLYELHGARERWPQTQQSLLWSQVTINVPPFSEQTSVMVPVACSYDFNLASTKYFHGLQGGEVPLLVLFSGSIFYAGPGGGLQVARVPWSKECHYRLPLAVYAETAAHYYPDQAPIRLSRAVFDRLQRFKLAEGHGSAEAALGALLERAERSR